MKFFHKVTAFIKKSRNFGNRKTDVHLAAKVFTSAFTDDLMINRRWTAYCNKTNIPGSLSFREVIRVIADFLTPYVNMIASAHR